MPVLDADTTPANLYRPFLQVMIDAKALLTVRV